MSIIKASWKRWNRTHSKQWWWRHRGDCLHISEIVFNRDLLINWLHNFYHQKNILFVTTSSINNNFPFQSTIRLVAIANTRQFSRSAIKNANTVPEGYAKIKLTQAQFQVSRLLNLLSTNQWQAFILETRWLASSLEGRRRRQGPLRNHNSPLRGRCRHDCPNDLCAR